jgi:hypothetical protein
MSTYTLIELEKDIESIISELAEVRAKKGHDYSGTEDTLDNLRAFGWRGVVVRLGDKFHRLKHAILSGEQLQVIDESLEDTMQDFINYALFLLVLYRQEKVSSSENTKEGFAPQGTSIDEGFKPKIDIDQSVATGGEIFASNKPKLGIVDWTKDIPGGSV